MSENKKFVILGLPRTGTCALRNSLSNAGLNVCPDEPFFADSVKYFTTPYRHDHLQYSQKIFSRYDGFKIIAGHSEQVLDICELNDAKLILTRRHNFLFFMASYYMLLTGQNTNITAARRGDQSNMLSYDTWTSSGNKAVYKPNHWIDHVVDKFSYYNYLVDNVYNQHKNYLTTVGFEDVTEGVSDLENYFDRPISLDITSNTSLAKYFVNHEEFEEDIKRRQKLILGL